LFQKRLNSLGYPGDYGLNSEQYQCYQRFVALFDEFRQLALISPTLTRQEALNALSQLATNTIFQAQKNNAPIQVSGLLEASGCEFDSLWVLGLTDHCLPAKTRLSAFIPPQLQHDLCMPHSTVARELHYAKQTIQRLHQGSQSTVFSYSKLQGDRPNSPSALITHYSSYVPHFIEVPLISKATLNEINEDYIIPPQPNEVLTGGTALLANQAKCPFKAFAEHRLTAKPMPEIVEGIDNKERGKIIHKIMEVLWHHLKKQSNLLFIEPKELDELIEQAINHAQPQSDTLVDEHLLQLQGIERTRLKRLVLASLEWEKQRPSFTVSALEQSYIIHLSGLEIKVRVDRLDTVDEKLWVIDYKSTLPTHKPWNEDRPQEPQLLLYALLNEHINTLLFMQIKTGKILCSGLSEHPSDVKGVSPLKKEQNWPDTREYWRQQLTTLAEELLKGYCPPQPINAAVCTYCDFKNLCRIQ
jgi:probable DNA repair protein